MTKLMILFLLCLPALAGDTQLMPRTQADLGADRPMVSLAKKSLNDHRQGVSLSRALSLEEGETLDLGVRPYQAQARGYWQRVTTADFNAGISLPISSAGALVRISPQADADGKAQPIDPRQMLLVSADGRAFGDASGMALLASAEELERAGKQMFSAGTSVFSLNTELGAGDLTLYADHLNYNDGHTYIIDVMEKNSPFSFNLSTANDTYLEGADLTLNAAFARNLETFAADQISASLTAPDGRTFPLDVQPGATRFELPLNVKASTDLGLWEVVVHAEANLDGTPIRRTARTAFALVRPTAIFSGAVTINDGKDQLRADLAMQVGSAGRYEVRGILFGSDENGKLQPIALGNSAQWLEAGQGSLDLSFDRALIDKSGLRAPFFVRDLRLINQSEMSLIHRQSVAFRIGGKSLQK